jgi:NADH-quinone oxidoreductase subunit I
MGALDFFGGFKLTFQHLTRPTVTTSYPKAKRPKQPRQHGRHVLNRYEDGMEKCIGCELCAGVCPVNCIYVRGLDNPPDHPVSPGERYGYIYEINYLRCIHCDMCVEACPTEAITESKLFEFSFTNRSDAIYTKAELLVDDQGTRRSCRGRTGARATTMTGGWMRATSPSGTPPTRASSSGGASSATAYAPPRPVSPAPRRRGDRLQAAARGARSTCSTRGHPPGPPRHARPCLAGQGGASQPQEDGPPAHEGPARKAQAQKASRDATEGSD